MGNSSNGRTDDRRKEPLGGDGKTARRGRRNGSLRRPGWRAAPLRPPLAHRVPRREASRCGRRFRTGTLRDPGATSWTASSCPSCATSDGTSGTRGVVAPGFRDPGRAPSTSALCQPPGDPRIFVKIGAVAESAPAPRGSTRSKTVRSGPSSWRFRRTGAAGEFHFPAGAGKRPQPAVRPLRHRERRERGRRRGPRHPPFVPRRQIGGRRSAKPSEPTPRGAFRPRLAERGAAPWPGAKLRAAFCGRWRTLWASRPTGAGRWSFVRGQLGSMKWPADPPDPKPRAQGGGGRQGLGVRLRVPRDRRAYGGRSPAGLGQGGRFRATPPSATRCSEPARERRRRSSCRTGRPRGSESC